MEWLIALVVGLVAVGAFLYWQLVIAEGAYLGPRVVALLYDWSARAYDRIKGYDPAYERWFLSTPLVRALQAIPSPLVLDVGTGTGRLPRLLLSEEGFRGRVIGLDYSLRMLREAAHHVNDGMRCLLLHQEASALPFEDETFTAVTCLEALEFTPNPRRTLEELVRVLQPGGLLLVSNRIGKDARLLPGRSFSPEEFEAVLRNLGLEMIHTQSWQEDYDLVWAVKPGVLRPREPQPFPTYLRCPRCNTELVYEAPETGWQCPQGHVRARWEQGIVRMV